MDRTYQAVRRQLFGMNCHGYEVGIRDPLQGKIMHRQWDSRKILQSLPFLKAQNVAGDDLYIRPLRSEGLVLVDDVGLGTLQRMDEEGCNPAAIIQTSPMNYQAWVRIQRAELDQQLATQVARLLAERYGGDRNSADWRHYGRLAGFTNCKPEYQRPYVLAERCNGKVATLSSKILLEASKRLSERRGDGSARGIALETIDPSSASTKPPPRSPFQSDIDPAAYATRQYQKLARWYGSDFDESRADYMVASDLLRMGLDDDQARAVLERTSPHLAQRKEGHIDDYLERTIAAALHRVQHANEP